MAQSKFAQARSSFIERVNKRSKVKTGDSFQNFAARLGIGTDNLSSASRYGFNPITRNRQELEWMYRGSWIVGQAVDTVANDVTKMGVEIISELKPDAIKKIQNHLNDTDTWGSINRAEKWSRLYGGSLGVIMIEGQNTATPLRIDTVGKGQYKGILVLDRWMVQPTFSKLIQTPGPDFGLPEFYNTVDGPGIPKMKIHYSRCLRLGGVELPYIQRLSENLWGMSVVERLFDRLVAFDSATQGASQLMYKAYLRTLSIENLREIVAAGGPAYEGLVKTIEFMRLMQSNEGITTIDTKDKFEGHQYSFSGVDMVLLQMGQQLSGALGIPLVRLFGQSPAGLNATGDSDIRTYYDNLKQEQMLTLHRPVGKIIRIAARSAGFPLEANDNFEFNPLWQMTDEQKANVTNIITTAVVAAEGSGLLKKSTAMKELKQLSLKTGYYSNITGEDIVAADAEPPAPGDDIDITGGQPNEREELQPGVKTMRDAMPFMRINGLDVVIETPKGFERRGNNWRVTMPAHYGYIRGTQSAEGPYEAMDCYVGPKLESQKAWVVHQKNLDTGDFDEHKVMLGYPNKKLALADYDAAFSDGRGRDRVMKVEEHTSDSLLEWVRQHWSAAA